MPETGDEYPSRTLADRERSQDNRGSRKVARLRNGGSGGKRPRGAGKSGQRSGVPTRIPGYSKFLLETKSGLLDAIYRHNVARANGIAPRVAIFNFRTTPLNRGRYSGDQHARVVAAAFRRRTQNRRSEGPRHV